MATLTNLDTATFPAAQEAPQPTLSVVSGPTDPPLVDLTFGELLDLQTLHHGSSECLVIPWTGTRWTYGELNQQSRVLARALLALGVRTGDRVGIMAGNCEQWVAVLFAATRIGALLVILNNTYTATEAKYALDFTGRLDICSHIPTCHTPDRYETHRLQSLLHNQDYRPTR
jgi:acyl-CoA synthetase (AMP-forming)/AMP-acid ligase II